MTALIILNLMADVLLLWLWLRQRGRATRARRIAADALHGKIVAETELREIRDILRSERPLNLQRARRLGLVVPAPKGAA